MITCEIIEETKTTLTKTIRTKIVPTTTIPTTTVPKQFCIITHLFVNYHIFNSC